MKAYDYSKEKFEEGKVFNDTPLAKMEVYVIKCAAPYRVELLLAAPLFVHDIQGNAAPVPQRRKQQLFCRGHGSSGKASDNRISEKENQGKQVASSSVLLPGRTFVNRPNRRRPCASSARAVAKFSVQVYGGGRQRYGVQLKDGAWRSAVLCGAAEARSVCSPVSIPRYKRSKGPWQRLRRCPKATGGIYIHFLPFFPCPIPDWRHPRKPTGCHAVLPGPLLPLPPNFRQSYRQKKRQRGEAKIHS